MKQFAIYEGNLERLQKKLTRIQNKCIKYGCDFHYQEVGEEFREVELEDGTKAQIRYVVVEAEGTAKINDWRFVASIDHLSEGNMINQYDISLEVPERYRHTDCVCEHCNRARARKQTCLIYNESTQEWKQVGKSCLLDYTGGLSAERVAEYISWFDTLIQGEEPYGSSYIRPYYPIEEILKFANECVNKFGYFNSDTIYPTRSRAFDYYLVFNSSRMPEKERNQHLENMQAVNFNQDSEENIQKVQDMVKWAREVEDTSDYMFKMKLILGENNEYVDPKYLGILVSLVPTYNRHIEHEVKIARNKTAHQQLAESSGYVGSIGDRLTVEVESVKCLYSGENQFGVSFLYQFIGKDGNCYMWWASRSIDVDNTSKVVGTVKNFEEYNGVKQTWLTRCRCA